MLRTRLRDSLCFCSSSSNGLLSFRRDHMAKFWPWRVALRAKNVLTIFSSWEKIQTHPDKETIRSCSCIMASRSWSTPSVLSASRINCWTRLRTTEKDSSSNTMLFIDRGSSWITESAFLIDIEIAMRPAIEAAIDRGSMGRRRRCPVVGGRGRRCLRRCTRDVGTLARWSPVDACDLISCGWGRRWATSLKMAM